MVAEYQHLVFKSFRVLALLDTLTTWHSQDGELCLCQHKLANGWQRIFDLLIKGIPRKQRHLNPLLFQISNKIELVRERFW